MKNIKDFKDIGAIIEITPARTLPTWIGLVQGSRPHAAAVRAHGGHGPGLPTRTWTPARCPAC